MKRGLLLFLLLLLLFFPKELEAVSSPLKGIGVCHVATKMDETINWSYDATQLVVWKNLEPYEGQYDFSSLDNLINSYQGQNVKIWLAIQTVAGDYAPPDWMIEKGAEWFSIIRSTGKDDGLFAPWDQEYLQYLEKLLKAINNHLESKPQAYQDTVGGIMMMSGGMYGEMQLWSGSAEAILTESLGLDPNNNNDVLVFRQAYYRAILSLVDLYMEAFPSWPVTLQVGYNFPLKHPDSGEVLPLDQAVVEAKVPEYQGRLFLKYNGLDPTNVGDGKDDIRQKTVDYYSNLFSYWALQTQVGFEVGHPWFYGNPPTQAAFWTEDFEYDPTRFENVFAIAREAKASFVCFQPEMIGGLRQTSSWRAFDAQLEAVHAPPFPTGGAISPTNNPTNSPPDCSCSSSQGRDFHSQGDGNCDGQTDIIDYNYWFDAFVRSNFSSQADFSCDGRVTISDYEVWRRNAGF